MFTLFLRTSVGAVPIGRGVVRNLESPVGDPVVIIIATPESTLSLSPLATSAPGEVLEETALQQDVLALFDRFRLVVELSFSNRSPAVRSR